MLCTLNQYTDDLRYENIKLLLMCSCCFLTSSETINPIFGRTLNPFDPSRVPGGSTGGEAALIGAGASVLGMICKMY